MRRLLTVFAVAALGFAGTPHVAEAGLDFGNAAALSLVRAAADSDSTDLEPAIATDGTGVWVASWVSEDPANGIPSDHPDCVVFSRSTDNGETWTLPDFVLPGGYDGFAFRPSLATDGIGNWILVWDRGSELVIAVSADNGASWALSATLMAGSSRANADATVTTDGTGNWVVVWWSEDSLGNTIGEDGDILVSRSSNLGLTWSAPATVNAGADTDPGGDAEPQAAFNSLGTLGVVWSIGNDFVLFARSIDGGVTFTDQVSLNTTSEFSGGPAPDLAPGEDGTWIVVWKALPFIFAPQRVVFFSRSIDDGVSWSVNQELHPYFAQTGATVVVSANVASLADGQWAVFYTSPDGLKGARAAGDWRITASYSRDAGVTWSSPSSFTSRSRQKVDPFEEQPAFAQGADGRMIALWRSEDSLGGTIGTDRDILTATMTPDCPAVARNDCRRSTEPDGSILRIKDKLGGKDSLSWRLRNVEATLDADLGDPVTSDDMVVCLYEEIDGSAGLVSEWDARAGGICNAAPCWSQAAGEVTLRDSKLEYGAVRAIDLKAGDEGRASLRLRLFGATLAPPRLPLDTAAPVRIQLINLGTNVCWEGVHDQAKTNDAVMFVSKSN